MFKYIVYFINKNLLKVTVCKYKTKQEMKEENEKKVYFKLGNKNEQDVVELFNVSLNRNIYFKMYMLLISY